MDHSGSINRSDSATKAPLDPSSWLPDGAEALRSPAAQSFRLLQSLKERARMTRTSHPAPMLTVPPPLESNESNMSPQLLHNYSLSALPVFATNERNAVPQEQLHRSLLTQHLTQQTMLPPRVSSDPWGMPAVSPLNYWSVGTLPSMTPRPTFHPSPPLDYSAIPDFFSAAVPNQTFPPSTNFPPIPHPPAPGDGNFNAFTDRRASPCNSAFSSPAHSPLRSPFSSPAHSSLRSPSIPSPANHSPVDSPTPSRSQSLTRDLSAVQIEAEFWGQGEGGGSLGAISGPNTTPPRLLGSSDGGLLTLAALDRFTPQALVALGLEMVGPDIMNSLTLQQLYTLVQASIEAQAHALRGAASTLAEEALSRGQSPSARARMSGEGKKGRSSLSFTPETEAAVEAETSCSRSLSKSKTPGGGQRETVPAVVLQAAPFPPCALALPFLLEGGGELLGGSLDLFAVEPDWDPLRSLPSAPSFNVMDLLNLEGDPEAATPPPPLHSNPSIDLLPYPPGSESTMSSLTSVSVWGRNSGEGTHSQEGGRDLFTWEGGGGGGGGAADVTQMRSDAEAAAQKGGGVGGGDGKKGDGSGALTQSAQAWQSVRQGESISKVGEGEKGDKGEKGERRSRTPKRQREELVSGRGSEASQVQSAGEARASWGKSPNSSPGMGVEMQWLRVLPEGQLSQCNQLQRLLTQFYDRTGTEEGGNTALETDLLDLLDARSPMGAEELHATVVSDALSSGNAMAEEVQKYILLLESEWELKAGLSPHEDMDAGLGREQC